MGPDSGTMTAKTGQNAVMGPKNGTMTAVWPGLCGQGGGDGFRPCPLCCDFRPSVGKVGFEGHYLARGDGLRGRCGRDCAGKVVGMVFDLAHFVAIFAPQWARWDLRATTLPGEMGLGGVVAGIVRAR